MKLTRTLLLGIAFLAPTVSSFVAQAAEDKPAAEAAPAEGGEKKAAKGHKKGKKAEEKKDEAAPAAEPAKK